MESTTFTNPVRAQLTTTAYKPCTYFAIDDRLGTRVFVKGPYKDEVQVNVPIKVFEFKSIIGVPVTTVKAIKLVPDGMPDCQYGTRMSIDRSEPQFFQVADDILARQTTLPTKERSSQKAWPTPVTVVDWEQLDGYSHVEYNKSYSRMIYKSDKKAARTFVKHIMLSWICGAGADLAFSNFIYDKDAHQVFQVDHEDWLKFDWSVCDTRVGSTRTKAWDHLEKFVKSDKAHFQAFFDKLSSEEVVAQVEKHFPAPEGALLVERMMEVAADWTVVGTKVITRVTPPPTPIPTKPDTPSPVRIKKRALEIEVVNDNDDSDVPLPPPAPKKSKVVTARPVTPIPVNLNKPEYVNGIYVGVCTPTYRVAVDPWGFTVSLRKSDLQKAIRRGNFEQAMVAFFSCYNIHRIYPDVQNAKSIKTNIINRLLICAMEDVGVANVNLVMEVASKLDQAVKPNGIKPTDMMYGAMIYNLCTSAKTRIQSHIAHAFHPKNSEMSKKEGVRVNPNPVSSKDPGWFYVAALEPETAWIHLNARYPLLYKIYKRMAEKNKSAVLRFALCVDYFKACGNINPSSDHWIYHGIPNNPHIDEIFQNKYRLDPMDCAYDKHTAEGRGKTVRQFREEGAIVNNEAEMFNYPVYKKIYINSNA